MLFHRLYLSLSQWQKIHKNGFFCNVLFKCKNISLTSFLILFYFAIIHSRSFTHSHSSLHSRCDLGSCSGDVASCCLPNPPRYCHGDCFSWRYPDEDAEDADPPSHHLQFNHRCSVTDHLWQIHYIITRILDILVVCLHFVFTAALVRLRANKL